MSTLRDTTAQDRSIEPRGFARRHRALLAGLAVAAATCIFLGVLFWRYSGAGSSVSRDRLVFGTVERGTFVEDVAADGQVVAAVSPTLYAVAAGTVNLKVHAGDAVSKGDVLAVVDSPDLAAKLSQEEATLAGLDLDWKRAAHEAERTLSQVRDAYVQAEVDRKTAERERDRSRKAYELGAYSELQALKAEDALEKARFTFEQARGVYEAQPAQNRFEVQARRAALDRQRFMVDDLKRQVDKLDVRSPVEGRVGQVFVADRASVAKDAPLVSVIDLSALEVEIKVGEVSTRDLRPGMPADLQGGSEHWKGVVSGVSPEVVAGQVTARLRFADDKPSGLRQSQRVAVRIFVDRRENVLVVDRGSFVDSQGGNFAYVVSDGVAERRPVRIGAQSVSQVEILEGLRAGDVIVVSGTDEFKDAPRVILSR